MEQTNKKFEMSNKLCLGLIVCFALALRLLIAMFYNQPFDLQSYNIPWAIGMQDGIFSAYANIDTLNYPPLFPLLLSIVGGALKYAQSIDFWQLQMLLAKLMPILFDIAVIIVIYLIAVKQSQLFAVMMSTIWALNLSAIFNVSYWGQADSMLIFFVLITFYMLQKRLPAFACIFFALGCLAKLQMVYFAPLLLLELYFQYKRSVALKSLGCGVAVGVLGWLPFMIGSKEALLPFRIYLGGFNEYNYINLNAFNLYGTDRLNWVTDNKSILGGVYSSDLGFNVGGFTYSHLGTVFMVVILVGLIFSYWYCRKHQVVMPVVFHAMFYMNTIFMITTKMHERYQLPVMILAFLCFLHYQSKPFFIMFLSTMVITFMNQAALLFKINFQGPFETALPVIQFFFSLANIALLIYMFYCYINVLLPQLRKNQSIIK